MESTVRAALAALLCLAMSGGAAAAGVTRVADLAPAARPEGVPAHYLVTPRGFFHPSCVVTLDDDEEVRADGGVHARDGRLRHPPACSHASFDAGGRLRAASPQAEPGPYSGWVADSNTDPSVSPPAGALRADWTVPAGPSNEAGQVLYFFPGLESVPRTLTILQPVLAWNGYGIARWTMANWNCCLRGTLYTGRPIAVETGDRIHGEIVGSACAAGRPCAGWHVASVDLSTGRSTTLTTESFGQAFDWYFGGVMEVYGVATCDQYPASGGVDFRNVHVSDVDLAPVMPVWRNDVAGAAPACDYLVQSTIDETLITFRTAP